MTAIYLASASPRRAQLLEQIGIDYQVLPVDIDETPQLNESPEHYVCRLAEEKASAAWNDTRRTEPWPVLAADTSVVLGSIILGKPANRDEGITMWRQLSGRSHQVLTAVCLCVGLKKRSALSVSEVHFRHLSDEEIHAYWQRDEGYDKAGGYGIQGTAARYIDRIDGSYSGVMGLPLHVVDQLLQEWDAT
ncbi:Maf family protein [Permianibacter aggregans]|uniref:dTTP/UTP pyrophosphatase n=1 Tax=Permianibacter aggregans TaxID=1510150 RepID=A0A4R6UI33_9GAMM|nr:Maf family protein [Permianibacter aggregans]QGX40657.1 septum formation inhibitor Maf [Permianibacter aggregans]TDQ46528.1 septum formation protein [Permianibacter aggregans]